MRPAIEAKLASTRLPLIAVALGVLLCAPSLDTGFVADDHVQRVVLKQGGGAMDLFTFASGDPDTMHALVDAGSFPWWADPHTRLSFLRPLSALTHILDFRAWPDSAVLAHAHNLLWFALAIVAAGMFYRRFLQAPALAGLALLLFAIDDVHGSAVGWIANRNAMIALAIGASTLLFHDRWRKDAEARAGLIAPALFAAGLLAGESTVAVLGYLIAYACFVDTGSAMRRILGVVPYAAVTLLWRIAYRALGYGALASRVYLDPATDPLAFANALPGRLLALTDGALALPWSDFWTVYPYISARADLVMTLVSVAVLVLLCWAFAPLLRSDAHARFFALGLLLAAVPLAATFPADRLLWFVSLGASALIAQLLIARATTLPRRALLQFMILLHIVLAPPLLALRSRSMDTIEKPLKRADESLGKYAELSSQTVVLVNPPADFFAGFLRFTRLSRDEVHPRHLRWLASGSCDVRIERIDSNTLRVMPEGGFYANLSEQMFRSPRRPMRAGDRIALTGLTIEVESLTDDERAKSARFSFDLAIDHPSLRFLRWDRVHARYVDFTPPAVGQTTIVTGTPFLEAVFGAPR